MIFPDGMSRFRNCSGTAGNPITYKANGAVQINGTADYGTGTGWGTMRFQNVSYCVFNGFVIDAANHANILLELDDAMGPVSNIEVENCSFRNAAFGATIRAVVNCSFHNNVIFNCSAFGLYADGYASGVSTGNKIWNNTIVNCAAGANIGAGDVTTEYRNNIFYELRDRHRWRQAGYCNPLEQHVLACRQQPRHHLSGRRVLPNPLLGSILELLAGSPAIDAGINVGLPFNGTAPDIGAFESAASPPAGGTVTGQVTAGGARLRARCGVGAYATAVTDVNGNLHSVSDLGHAECYGLQARGWHPGYGAVTQPATIPANGSVTLNFVLTANPGNTWYVSTTGSDTNNGLSTATAWADLTPAASQPPLCMAATR